MLDTLQAGTAIDPSRSHPSSTRRVRVMLVKLVDLPHSQLNAGLGRSRTAQRPSSKDTVCLARVWHQFGRRRVPGQTPSSRLAKLSVRVAPVATNSTDRWLHAGLDKLPEPVEREDRRQAANANLHPPHDLASFRTACAQKAQPVGQPGENPLMVCETLPARMPLRSRQRSPSPAAQ